MHKYTHTGALTHSGSNRFSGQTVTPGELQKQSGFPLIRLPCFKMKLFLWQSLLTYSNPESDSHNKTPFTCVQHLKVEITDGVPQVAVTDFTLEPDFETTAGRKQWAEKWLYCFYVKSFIYISLMNFSVFNCWMLVSVWRFSIIQVKLSEGWVMGTGLLSLRDVSFSI